MSSEKKEQKEKRPVNQITADEFKANPSKYVRQSQIGDVEIVKDDEVTGIISTPRNRLPVGGYMTRKQAEQISQDMYQLEALEAFLNNLKLLIEDIAPRHYAYIRLERCTINPGMDNQVLIEEKEVLEAIYTAKSAQRERVVERLKEAGVEL